jgi:hypothetical protein
MGMLKTAVRTALMCEADTDEGILSMLMARLNSVLPQVKEAQMYATFTGLRLNRNGQLFYGMAASRRSCTGAPRPAGSTEFRKNSFRSAYWK